MTMQSAPYYWLTCDQEGCTARSTDDGEYAAWADHGAARDEAVESGWVAIDGPGGGELYYCETHSKGRACTECDEAPGEGSEERDGMCRACWDEWLRQRAEGAPAGGTASTGA